MTFFYPHEVAQFDLQHIAFLDKEFDPLFPESDAKRRFADKLAKIPFRDGGEQWALALFRLKTGR